MASPGRDLLPGGCHPDDARLPPPPVGHLQGVPHHVHVPRAVEGVVVPPLLLGQQGGLE